MAISPVSFSLPVSALREPLDRSGHGHGGHAMPTPGAVAPGGSAGRFAAALQDALKAGGPEALDQIAQAALGSGFMSTMQGAGAAEAAGLADANLLLDALQGTGGKAGAMDLTGLIGAAIPGGLKGTDLSRVAEALRGFGMVDPATGAATQPTRVSGPTRTDGPTRVARADYDPHSTAPAQIQAPASAVDPAPRPEDIVSAASPADNAKAASAAAKSNPQSPTLPLAKAALARRAYGQAEAHAAKAQGPDVLGMLSARFESGGDAAAVGYDRVGGTSYGTYQISSRAGTFDGFMNYLRANAPDIAARLAAAGPANTGSTAGPMPSAWKTIAHEQPQRFQKLQHDFIKETHFKPALQKIADATGIDLTGRHQALAQVLWSTAVQHGATGSARIFSAALDALGSMAEAPDADRSLITQIYARRAGNFSSSTEHVQQAVRGRFNQELKAALSLLNGTSLLDTGA